MSDQLLNRPVRLSLGTCLLVHFTALCLSSIYNHRPDQMWWISNVSLLLTAIGFFAANRLVMAVSLTNVLVFHSVWVADFVAWQWIEGYRPALTSHLESADAWTWLMASHHFYLMPLLLWVCLGSRQYPSETWLASATLFAMLTLISRGLLSVSENVNCAFFLPESLHVLTVKSVNDLPASLYLVGLNVVVNFLAFGPATALLVSRTWRHTLQTTVA